MELTGLTCSQIDIKEHDLMLGNWNSILHKAQILSLLLLALTSQAAISASAADQAKQVRVNKPAQKPVDLMTAYQKIQSPQGFPDLPVFPGKITFIGGYYMPEQNGISMCQMRYLAKEEPKDVIDFYKDAIEGNGWKVLQCISNHLTARHSNGHMCSVNVTASKLPKVKSLFIVAYRQVNRQH
jgi:hypothetical protein